MEPITNIALAVAAFVLLIAVAVVISASRMKTAVTEVIQVFRQHHSSCSETPRTVDELGLKPRGLFDLRLGLRDYKPYALKAMIQSGVVRVRNDGSMCLAEEKLSGSPFDNSAGEARG
ncbi:MAG: hypothetical protein HY900_02220 [Deltaproteobacteria bacterium]|nr:hypothetical protein [Deltaproteobacteria bacterium]